jgi:hypothetical protein
MSARTTFWILVISCVLLAIAVLMPNSNGSTLSTPTKKIDPHSSPSQQIMQKERVGELTNYSAILEQPLFSPDRLRNIDKNDSESLVINDNQYSPIHSTMPEPPMLLGVMSVNDTKRAFVIAESDTEVKSLKPGDEYQQWTMTTINTKEVVMTHQGRDVTLPLNWLGKEILQMENNGKHQQQLTGSLPATHPKSRADETSQTLNDKLNAEFIDQL